MGQTHSRTSCDIPWSFVRAVSWSSGRACRPVAGLAGIDGGTTSAAPPGVAASWAKVSQYFGVSSLPAAPGVTAGSAFGASSREAPRDARRRSALRMFPSDAVLKVTKAMGTLTHHVNRALRHLTGSPSPLGCRRWSRWSREPCWLCRSRRRQPSRGRTEWGGWAPRAELREGRDAGSRSRPAR